MPKDLGTTSRNRRAGQSLVMRPSHPEPQRLDGAVPVVQLSNDVQMKMEPIKTCTNCGAEGHCVQDCPAATAAAPRPDFSMVQPETGPLPVPFAQWGRTIQSDRAEGPGAAAAAAPERASSSGDHHGASPAEPASSMPPPRATPAAPSYSDAQVRFSRERGGGLGSAGTAPPSRPGFARYRPEHAAAAAEGEEAPEVPEDVPASAFGNGTYDAYHAERRAAKGKSKGKSKNKSKKGKGKDSDLNKGRNQTNWWNRDLWSYDRS